MAEVNHRFIQTNGIRMHIAEQGEGPLVILCHGFPELWYSWRHQLPALAEVGYHAVAPDQRGYGQTDQPESIDIYNILQLTADIVGLVQALGEEQAVIAGHDWGAHVARSCALLRPDMFRAVALFSTPFVMRSWDDPRPTQWMKQTWGEGFYVLQYQEPGIAEAEMETNVRWTLCRNLIKESMLRDKPEQNSDTPAVPATLPTWITEEDLDYITREFERTGFRGGLNWYRNYDRNWELTSFLAGEKLLQPTLYIAGEYDGVLEMRRAAYDVLEETVPNLWKKVVLPNTGHWAQQERPAEVNQLLIEFLASLSEK
ncbi:MAG TPA: alpha/beta hydrolase [Anaerolineales bacterium]|nr:alpha/beta hydrolase [Anaerolineales bacterium]